MERLDICEKLSGAFGDWKSGQKGPEVVDALNEAIQFARNNGIDLVLKVPKSVLDKPAIIVPILKHDVISYSSGVEKSHFIFEIPSELSKSKIGYSKKLSLIAAESLGASATVLILKHQDRGFFGMFKPDQVEALQPK
ncbi:MAG: hypothetical protein NTZ07_04130 [Candidatus Woesebacteria bacterium]|nr:hypothetical protein [Candidatus Woesebacteria bacterium]